METSLLEMAANAALIMADPARFGFLCLGVVIGLAVGAIPGLGGIVGLSLLLPFTYGLDPYAALAMLIGLGSVVHTSDTIPAVLFGVPGTAGSAATVLDGHPMARRGEARRAFGAAFTASLLGGLIGAVILGFSVPVLRPLMLAIATPELLAFCLFGLSLVAALSGTSAFKGLAAACLGLLIATIGEDTQTAQLRWTMDSIYLWDGVPIVPLALGLFAIPELADMAIRRTSIAGGLANGRSSSTLQGVRDVLANRFLVLRCAGLGSLLGSVPGIGTPVIDWIAYGHAARTEKDASTTFGKGDVRGVIASESANNAKEGGALVPTIAFGVPGSASMALLLGAFAVHGIVPGPSLLGERLDITYTLVWSIALANVMGTALCFLGAGQLAKLTQVRAGILVPVVLAITFIGAYQSSRDWGDLFVLLAAGALGFAMKRLAWPRPPVILGFVLGALVERYMFISVERYGLDWMSRPIVAAMLLLALYSVLAPTIRRLLAHHTSRRSVLRIARRHDVPVPAVAFTTVLLAVFAAAVIVSSPWSFAARLIPQVIGTVAIVATLVVLASQLFEPMHDGGTDAPPGGTHVDLTSEFEGLSPAMVGRRSIAFFAWCLFIPVAAFVIGMLPALAVFIAGYIRLSGSERPALAIAIACVTGIVLYILFHQILTIPWPDSLVGDLFPWTKSTGALRLF